MSTEPCPADGNDSRATALEQRLLDPGGPRRRGPSEARRLDHRPDLLHGDLHLRRHAGGDRLRRAEAASRGIRPLRQPQREGGRAEAGRAGRRRGGRCSIPSGMAAIAGLLLAKLNAGDEVVLFDECYHRSREFCTKHLGKFGVVTHQVPACDYDGWKRPSTPRPRC